MLVEGFSLPTILEFLLVFLAFELSSQEESATATSNSQPCVRESIIPIQVPIRNVTFGDGTVRRGVGLAIGTPPQPLAFRISVFALPHP